ncbi:Protein RETICULATA-RELATED 5 chloroplastic [Bienertia sinuspersici]
MKPQAHRCVDYNLRVLHYSTSNNLRNIPAKIHVFRRISTFKCRISVRNSGENREDSDKFSPLRRGVVFAPVLAVGASFLRSTVVMADENVPEASITTPEKAEKVEELASRIYDATSIGEPLAVGKDKSKVWEKVMNARIVYLGEAEQVPIRDDKDSELEIVKNLKKKCVERTTQSVHGWKRERAPKTDVVEGHVFRWVGALILILKIDGDILRSYTAHWPPERWQEYEPLLVYCRDNGIRLVACGAPLEVMRTVQAEGIHGLSNADRKKYIPPAGSGFISGFGAFPRKSLRETTSLNEALSFGPSSYVTVQARAVEDYIMAQVILQGVIDRGASGLLIVITGASHVMYGARGTGIPARISKKMQKKNQVVILLNPERQFIRNEGEVPVADFLWYSAARPCSRNCFDRAEIARVMNAAGRRRDALPQDLQKGLDLGLVSPEVLQYFFDLEQYPVISELTHQFQGFRERLLADPKFLNKLAIEEAISMTTTLLAQYEKRKGNFFLELDYVITDTLRGAVVDFFTVWLPAPTLSFLSFSDEMGTSNTMDSLKGLLGSIPDNAFQKNPVGKNWDLSHRLVSVLVGGMKLAGVGFVSSIGAVASSNVVYALRQYLNPSLGTKQKINRSPILKTAIVYSSFLGTSANIRYQVDWPLFYVYSHYHFDDIVLEDERKTVTILSDLVIVIITTPGNYL